MKTVFDSLHPSVRTLLKERGFEQPTPIQEKAIPVVSSGRHTLVLASTGMGKTETVFLPIFSKLMENPKALGIQVLYITPLRALNRDMLDRMKWWSEKLGLTLEVRHGDTTPYQRSKQAKNPPQILITTPETLQNILPARKMGAHLTHVHRVVIDEIHELVESKRGVQLSIALERLVERTGEFQRIGLSATVGDPEETAKFLAGTYRDAKIVNASSERNYDLTIEHPMPKKEDKKLISELHVTAPVIARLRRLHELIDQHRSVLCFVNTRSMTELLSSRMSAWDTKHGIKVHHSSLSKEVRIVAEKEFKDGSVKGLFATSSLELGIDIGSIDLVTQYMSPRQASRLVQRIGRSGHSIKKKPKGIVICSNAEDILEAVVIAERALKGQLEDVRLHEGALDVLAHQLIGLSMDSGRIDIKKAFQLVRRSYLYRNLEYDDFLDVLDQLASERYIWLDPDNYKKSKSTLFYYFGSVSMIPDEQRFFVKNALTRTNVAMLDESFVAENLKPGITFISKGTPWHVLDIAEREVIVEPASDITAAIPDWQGSEIPVPFEVAQAVGALRRKARIDSKLITKNAKRVALDSIKKQKKSGFVPDDKTIILESHGTIVFMHSHFGSLVNETLGKVIAALLTSITGRTIRMRADAYRIMFEFPTIARPDLIEKFLIEIEPKAVGAILTENIARSSLFKYEFVHVAKRFGLLEKGANYQRIGIRKIIEAVIDSPIAKEVLRTLFTEKLDIEKTKEVLELIKNKKIKIKKANLPKPSEFTSFAKGGTDLILPERALADITELVKERILSKNAHMICTYCHHSWYSEIRDLPKEICCSKCGASMVTYAQKRGAKKLFEKKKLTKEESEEKKKLVRIAKLVNAHGRDVVIALTARGVGPTIASRVLRKAQKTEDLLFRDLVEAERNFTKTHRYWTN
ncbi:DEAD/DEAH box helicase [archaeon]|nr:DEAD/DEAH box helicase [archaeon]